MIPDKPHTEGLSPKTSFHVPDDIESLSLEEARRRLCELRLQKSELETQNAELRRAHAALDISIARYFDLYDQAPVGYITLCDQGLIREANLAATDMLGVAQSELVNEPISRFILPEDQEAFRMHHKRLLETGAPKEWAQRMVRSVGDVFWAHLTGSATPGAEGIQVTRVLLSEITARKKAHEAQRKTDELNRCILRASPDAISVTDLDGRILMVSPATLKMFGCEREGQMLGCKASDFLIPEDRERAWSNRDLLFEGTLSGPGEYRGLRLDGGTFEFEVNYELIRDAEGRPAQVLLIVRDITERKRVENALRESEAKHRLLFDSAGDAIFLHDEQGRIAAANALACERLGYSQEEMLSMTVGQVDAPEEALHVPERITKLMAQGHIAFETVHRQKDGTRIPTEVTARCVTWNGRPGILSICRDITERKRADEALRQEQRFSRSLLDSLPGIFYLYSYPELRLVLWNKKHETFFGYRAEELDGIHVTHWFPAEAKDAALSAIAEGMAMGQHSMETLLLTKDGRRVPFYLTGLKFEAQGQSYFMGIGIDISERKLAEEALQKALNDIKTLRGIVPICAWCKKIRDDSGYWTQVEVYVREHTEAEFSHGICPECRGKMQTELGQDNKSNPSK